MKGLTSNKLKVIAIILMICDYIGYYFVSYISKEAFDVLRFFGRMAMPIFAFLIVQGFFYTKNIKKYIFKLFVTATLFQLALFILGIINQAYVPNYYIVINTYLNILYSFVLCLLLISLVDKDYIVKNKIVNFLIKLVGVLAIINVYFIVDIELGLRVLVSVFGMYIAEKVKRKWKNNEISLMIIFFTLIIALFTDMKNFAFNAPSVISILFIAAYNGERGLNKKWLKNMFYIIYPMHHVILYIIALFITYKLR